MTKIVEKLYLIINFLVLLIFFLLAGLTIFNYDYHEGNFLYRKLDKRFVQRGSSTVNPADLLSMTSTGMSPAIFAIEGNTGYLYDPDFYLAEGLNLMVGETRYFNEEDYENRNPVGAKVNHEMLIEQSRSEYLFPIGRGAVLYRSDVDEVLNLTSLDKMPEEVFIRQMDGSGNVVEEWLLEAGYQEVDLSQENIFQVLFSRRDRIHPILTAFSMALLPLYGSLALITGIMWQFRRKHLALANQQGVTWARALAEEGKRYLLCYGLMFPVYCLLAHFLFRNSYYQLSFANQCRVFLLHISLSVGFYVIGALFVTVKRRGGKQDGNNQS